MRFALGLALAILMGAMLFVLDAAAQDGGEKDVPKAGGNVALIDPTTRDLDAYRLRVGDEVEIVVYRLDALKLTQIVPANGDISFLPVGKVNLLGKTVFEVEETIAQRLKDGEFVTDPRVGCVVTTYAPREVPLIGAVQGMVTLPTHRNIRLLELLARAGALSTGTQADFSKVVVRRTGPDGRMIPIPVNVDDVLQSGNESQNIIIREDDLIIVPRLQAATPQSADWVYVLGSVNQPGRHPIIQGRTPFTLTKLIAIVGDFTEFADRSEVKVIRQESSGRRFVELDFDEIISGDLNDFVLQADDLIVVPERLF